MKAVVFEDNFNVAIREVQDPKIEDGADAIVRLTSSALCGSDLHMYEGRTPPTPGLVMGHEGMGVIEAIGDAVRLRKVGDRVVMPAHVYCGVCVKCAEGKTAECLTMRPGKVGAAYGYANKGHFGGMHAQYVRVPFADANCIPLPGSPNDANEDNFLMLADAFVGGWHAADLAKINGTATVAVFGAGPIGLLSAYSSLLRGAGIVYVVDGVDARLKMAESIGAVAVDFRHGNPVDQIRRLRMQAGLPPGEEALGGVDAAIDAVGFQALNDQDPTREKANQVVENIADLVNYGGAVGIIGVYPKHDERPSESEGKNGSLVVPWGTFFSKGISIGTGRTNDRQYTRPLRDLVLTGRAHPDFVVTHHVRLDEAPEAYEVFAKRQDGMVKVVFRP